MPEDVELISCSDPSLLSPAQLRELAAYHERIREEERAHIAREIHDELGQYLTALRMDISLLRSFHYSKNPELDNRTARMKATVDQAIAAVRNIATTLRPTVLDMGLVAAAEWLLAQFNAHTRILCQLDASDHIPDLDDQRATVMFRVLQESLTNVARHANASRVTVRIKYERDILILEVRDNGNGFDPNLAGQKRGFGLHGIRERAMMLGGRARIESAPNKGTRVILSVPLERRRDTPLAPDGEERPIGEAREGIVTS